MLLTTIRPMVAFIGTLTLISGCGGSNDIQPTPDTMTALSIESRIATHLTEEAKEAWLCGVGNTVLAGYLFLPAGQIDGLNPEHRLGMEIDHSKASMADQTRYLWSVSDDASLIMYSPDRVESVTWTGIEFVDDNYIQLTSSNRGPMVCYRGSGQLPKDVS